MKVVAPGEDERRAEEGEGDECPSGRPLEGPHEDREADQADEEEEREPDAAPQLAQEATSHQQCGGRGDDEEDAEAGLQGAGFSEAASFAMTEWWRP